MSLHPECMTCNQEKRTCSTGQCSNPEVEKRLQGNTAVSNEPYDCFSEFIPGIEYTALPTDELKNLRENVENGKALVLTYIAEAQALRADNERLRSAIESARDSLTLSVADESIDRNAWTELAIETLEKALEVQK